MGYSGKSRPHVKGRKRQNCSTDTCVVLPPRKIGDPLSEFDE
jgi:hypothetical protein